MTSPLATCYCCGYHLGTLPDTERCPECGADAEYARRSLVQRFAHPERLRRCCIAAQFASSSMLAALLIGPVVASGLVFIIAPFNLADDLLRIALVLCAVVWVVAWAALTWADPTAPHDAFSVRATSCGIRVLALAACGVLALIILNVAWPKTVPFQVRNRARDIAPVLLAAQMFLVSVLCARVIALCHRRRKRAWSAHILRGAASLLFFTTLFSAATRIGGRAAGVQRGEWPGNLDGLLDAASTLASIATPVVIILALWTTNRLFLALRHASRRYNAHLAQTRAPDPAP